MTRGCICWRRSLLRGSFARHSPGSFSQVSMCSDSSTAGGMPISATTISPHRSRPGSNTCPGFLRAKVTVQTAGAAPTLAAVAHHAARHVDGDQRQPALRSRSQCCRDSALQGPTQAGSKQCIDDQRGVLDHPRLQCLDAAAPAVAREAAHRRADFPWAPSRATRTGQPALRVRRPRRNRRRHCCRVRTARGPAAGDQRRVISRTTASPAFCMSTEPGVPPAIAARSACVICATRSSAV